MKKLTTLKIKSHKLQREKHSLQMLTCYDFQTAQMLEQTGIDMLLVGDSLGNVMLGYETTVPVSLEEMKIFSAAVKRGAPNKFIVADLPFGSYSTLEQGIESATKLFQYSNVESIKLEGAFPYQLELIERLTQIGIPVMGHIGLTPQSVHELGGYYVHGKDDASAKKLLEQAINLEKAGVFAVVLECVKSEIATAITEKLSIPTIGIGAGNKTDGQVLVINDLLKEGPHTPPKFCTPIANLFDLKKDLITNYLNKNQEVAKANVQPSVH
ncbi:3-methyl-2-oxobutanoate hydroxymethyltransferase [Halobacteriovorax marinus SJ]|uniref:3-methyl-2-oxobutanoate hydroxymethyltransferase n=1 Tax=Halobacteriovorax marinus (strain ATCC BAA-682 / DSM 15412 / SJ) TaxID=862908 RepID=E1X544_HALMS|nr:3-methyl-2-oxobutanoate hydroxymethyltransferase [Halobacteriovorax marinus]CBW25515.1 3-methyl-2-oxobutanoate hydroxymethyltransferase [Halobacteriovorax marinus SJ]